MLLNLCAIPNGIIGVLISNSQSAHDLLILLAKASSGNGFGMRHYGYFSLITSTGKSMIGPGGNAPRFIQGMP
jgi:hypothetical protein